ncbi:two-component regulator propeller domain-containing protein [uncultured Gimesia sp.]|uniref:two-component regulator propeller domain-containing protein n=1 Tax=uncultured Gimesia sp. TaxID=1678688 RepID=UPI0030D98FA8|tara:strand:+ start:87754 stop:91467 length:3714 start_codon:yes stop_codon:yes gene_type:complete
MKVSLIIFILGLTVSFLLPWGLERQITAPKFEEQQQTPRSGDKRLANTPALAERPDFKLAVEIGAELSGACLQDRDGYLWVGTYGGGLYRYDSRHLKRFSASSGELSGSNVTSLYEDSDGVIWIGTLSGLNRYDKRTGHFSQVPIPPCPNHSGKAGIWMLHGDKNGHLWIGTNGQGLLKFNPVKNEVLCYRHLKQDATTIPHDNVYKITEDHNGKLLLATFGGGAARFDPATEKIDLRIGVSDGLSSSQAWSIFEDSQHRLWIGTQEGLDRFNPQTRDLTHFQFEANNPQTLGGPVVTSVHEDREGAFWITSFNGDASLSRLDPDQGTFTRFGPTPGGLSQRGARTVFEDASGIFWIVSLDGLVKFDPNSMGFDLAALGSGLLPIYEDREGTMWLGTIAGLRKFDRKKGTATPVTDSQLKNQLVSAFAEDSRQQFWIAIYGGDLLQFDRKAERVLTRYSHDPSNPQSIPASNCIRRILEDKLHPGSLWLLTQGGGLALFDTQTGVATRFVHDSDDPASLANDTASYGALHQDIDGTLWIGTDNGLDRLQQDATGFDHYWNGVENSGGLHSGVIQSIHRDHNRTLWIATSDGLHRLSDEENGIFERFTVKHGLSDNMVLGILEDEDRLWVSTADGLTAFDPTGKIPPQVFGREEGLPGDSFLLTSFYKTRDGEFWFGGPRGVTHFRPDKLKANDYIPPVVLTSLTQAQVPMALHADPIRVHNIELAWPANYFEFEAAALSYSMPGLNRYRYKLEGFDTTWFESQEGSGRYTGLPGGQYLLRIQGSNNSGLWNKAGVSLGVIVHPPFWETRWFRTLALVLATVLIAGTTRYVEVLRHEVLQRRCAERKRDTAELRMREATKMEALGRLAGGVAHDFNNLLTVILCELELANLQLEEQPIEGIAPALNSIEEAAERGTELTRQLLTFSSNRSSKRQLINYNELINKTLPFFSRVLGKDIHIQCELADSLGFVLADSGNLHQVLMNLIVNARHAMAEGGTLTISTFEQTIAQSESTPERPAGDFIGLAVRDTGCGMNEKTKQHIFDPFYTTKRNGEGTGLGLTSVKEIVEQHGGFIELESSPEIGTCFRLLLPKSDSQSIEQPIHTTPTTPEKVTGTILLIEDDRGVRKALREMLERDGYRIVEADNATKALAIWKETPSHFVAVVSDVVLPDLNGDKVVEQIRVERPEIPVLFISGYTPKQVQLNPHGFGPWKVLHKPIQRENLSSALSEIFAETNQPAS